jgi:hypothetical protein
MRLESVPPYPVNIWANFRLTNLVHNVTLGGSHQIARTVYEGDYELLFEGTHDDSYQFLRNQIEKDYPGLLIQKSPRQAARELLWRLASGSSDVYETYRSLYHLWCTQNAVVQELRPLFSIPGIEPDGQLSVTKEFKGQVRSSAMAILASLPD